MGTYAEYAALPGVRWSCLKLLRELAPLHYRYALDNPGAGNTASRVLLRAIHSATLTPGLFNTEYSVYAKTRSGAMYEAHLSAHPGTEAINPREMQKCLAISRAVHSHPVAGPYFRTRGWSEVTITWTDPTTGQACKGRIDRLNGEKTGPIHELDLKTLGSVDERSVRREIKRLGFLGQRAHYRAGIQARNPGREVISALICVEDKPPHDVVVWRFDPADIDAADEERILLLGIVAECERTGVWPGLGWDGPRVIDMDPWAEPEIVGLQPEESK